MLDVVKNRQGEDLMDFLGNTGMRVVNGRGGKDGFTCVSGRGSSVVDYCIVGAENLGLVCNFKVTTMSESIDAVKLRGACTRVPDHSLLQWDIVTDDVMEIEEEKPPERGKKYVVPGNYLESEVESIRGLMNRLRSDEREQKMLDEIYEEIVVVLNRGLVDKVRGGVEKGSHALQKR